MNINDLIMNTLNRGDSLDSVSTFLGLNPEQTRGAMSAAVPSLLAGLSHLSSTSPGAQQLSGAIAAQDPDLPDNISGAVSGQGTYLAEQGNNQLGSLLGGGMTAQLTGVLSRFTGLAQGVTGRMLGLLTPIILGILGRHQKSHGLDAGGVANLLAGQKENIHSAMPVGLSAMLSSALPAANGFFGGTRPTTLPELEPAQASFESPRGVDNTGYGVTPRQPSRMRWAVPAGLGLLAIALFGMWSSRQRAQVDTNRTLSMTAPAERVGTLPDNSQSLATDVSQLVTLATATLSNIKDSTSAEAALPRLKEINGKLAGLQSAQAKLPEGIRTYVRSSVNPLVARLREAVQPVLNIPGAAEVVRPVAEEMLGRLDALTQ